MRIDDSIMFKEVIFNGAFAIFGIYFSINLFMEFDVMNWKKIDFKSKTKRLIYRTVYPISALLFSIYIVYGPMLDYVIKDYGHSQNIISHIDRSKFYDSVYIKGTDEHYYVSHSLNINIDDGKKYEYWYGKRTRLIFKIREKN